MAQLQEDMSSLCSPGLDRSRCSERDNAMIDGAIAGSCGDGQGGGTLYDEEVLPENVQALATTARLAEPLRRSVPCAPLDGPRPGPAGCYTNNCQRVVIDDFFSAEETAELLAIAEAGMAAGGSPESASTGGPTIMDLNTGASPGTQTKHTT